MTCRSMRSIEISSARARLINAIALAGLGLSVFGCELVVDARDYEVDGTAFSNADTDPKCEPNSGMKFIPAGTFTMGDDDDKSKAGQVMVAAYCMDTTEVTTAAYVACVKSGKCTAADTGGSCNADVAGYDNYPINCVNWEQATAYCTAQGQRLPTEEEWEYAARGTDSRVYPWGNAEPAGQLCWNGQGNSLGKGNRNSTCAVASFPAGNSPFGLSDMSGNVEEWTFSTYSVTLPLSVVRGGNWTQETSQSVSSGSRLGVNSSDGFSFGGSGFRCVVTLK